MHHRSKLRRENPFAPRRFKRVLLIGTRLSGRHYGQRPVCAAQTGRTHGRTDRRAEHQNTLANGEPSTHGAKRTLAERPLVTQSGHPVKPASRPAHESLANQLGPRDSMRMVGTNRFEVGPASGSNLHLFVQFTGVFDCNLVAQSPHDKITNVCHRDSGGGRICGLLDQWNIRSICRSAVSLRRRRLPVYALRFGISLGANIDGLSA
jgi:hypothetical protein